MTKKFQWFVIISFSFLGIFELYLVVLTFNGVAWLFFASVVLEFITIFYGLFLAKRLTV